FVAADDLAAPDAIGVGEHDVEGFDFGVGFEESQRLVERRAGGRKGHAASSETTSPNASTSRSICFRFVAGDTSIMLWNGAIRQERLTRPRWIAASSSGACAFAASFPLASGPGAQTNS